MTRDPLDPVVGRLKEEYHAPPPTPREEMWREIEARIGLAQNGRASLDVIPIGRAASRSVRPVPRVAGWAVAAAAVLVVGVGIGRMSVAPSATTVPAVVEPDAGVMRAAALDHLGKSESLLTLVRADGRSGRVDPAVGVWARTLLTQTRLLLDRPDAGDPALRELLEDLELVLVQIVGVSGLEVQDGERVRSELNLALEGIEQREMLPRIQAVVPAGHGLAGT